MATTITPAAVIPAGATPVPLLITQIEAEGLPSWLSRRGVPLDSLAAALDAHTQAACSLILPVTP